MKFYKIYNKNKKLPFKKLISITLTIGLFLNNSTTSFSGILSEDGRYETFEGESITVDNVLEEGSIELDEIQGNTMVNYAQDGDKELILNGDIDLEGSSVTTTEGIEDGLVDVLLEGDTLVNQAKYKSISHSSWITFDGEYAIFTNPQDASNISFKLNALKPNTTYTLIFEVFSVFSNGVLRYDLFPDKYAELGEVSHTGIVKHKFQTANNINDLECLRYYVPSSRTGIVKVSAPIVLEGDWTNKEFSSYFEGMKSVGELEGNKIEITASNSDNTSSNKKEIILNEPLRGVSNRVKDRVVKKDGKWYIERNLKEHTLDGSERWDIEDSNLNTLTNVVRFMCHVYDKDLKLSDNNVVSTLGLNCNYNKDIQGVYTDDTYSGKLWVQVNRNALDDLSVESFKKFLNKNNISFVSTLSEPTYEPLEITPILNTYTGITNISNNSTIPANMKVKNSGYDCILKPNAKYTIAVDTDKSGTIGINLAGVKGTTNNNVLTLITPNVISDSTVRLYGKSIKASKIRVLEGDKTDSLPDYFEGVQSSFENNIQDDGTYIGEIISTNKNLVNINEVEGYDDSYGTLSKDANNVITYTGKSSSSKESVSNCKKTNLKVFLEKGQTYTFGFKTDGVLGTTQGTDTVEMFWLRNGNAEDSFFNVSTNSKTVTINRTGWYYARFDVNKGDSTHRFWDIFATKDSLDNEYIPHQSNNVQISLPKPLRAVGDVKDRIIKRNGQWMIERNIGSIELNGDEPWQIEDTEGELSSSSSERYLLNISNISNINLNYTNFNKKATILTDRYYTFTLNEILFTDLVGIGCSSNYLSIRENFADMEEFKSKLKNNPLKLIYELETPYYEPLDIDLSIKLFDDITHISNSSNIPANIKVTVDRAINRAVEAIELVESNPSVENLSLARMWANLLKETINKDKLQNQINNITKVEGLEIEKKTVSSNMDVYIKPLNSLSISLSTNQIMFEDYSSVNDLDMDNALQISVSSSLPYQLNSYLETDIQNSDGSSKIDKDLLHIKEDTESEYKQFLGINQKLILKEDCIAGSNNIHNIDLRLKASAHDADVYRTTIKFEAEQK